MLFRSVLQLEKEAGLGGGGRSGRLGRCETVEHVRGKGDLVGERRRGLVEDRSEKVRSDGGLARSRFTTISGVSTSRKPAKQQ